MKQMLCALGVALLGSVMPVGLDTARPWRSRGASYPRSRPDFSRRRRPALKPLFSRAVRTVARNAIRGCGCRCRAEKSGDA